MNTGTETPRRKECRLESVQDVREWLSDPENQVKTALYVIKWTGATPAISVHPVNRLNDLLGDRLFALAVLEEHFRRKTGEVFVGE